MSQSDFVTRGHALVTAGQYQEAVKVCRLGLLGRPTTVEGRVVLGQALLALKRFDEVLAEMRVALELDHTSIAAQILKGEALLGKGDGRAAVDVFARLRSSAPTDPRIEALLGEAERVAGRPAAGASHPSVGFVGGPAAQSMTRQYPDHGDGAETTDLDGVEDSYTRPTSLAAPGVKRVQPAARLDLAPEEPRARRARLEIAPEEPRARRARSAAPPPPAVLAVGDRSRTVDVDPDVDGLGLEDDFGDVIGPPPMARSWDVPDDRPRGQVVGSPSQPPPRTQHQPPVQPKPKSRPKKLEVSSVELMDDEIIELDETLVPPPRRKSPGPGPDVRDAVKLPAGPLDPGGAAAARPAPHQPTAPPPHLAQLIANKPHVVQMNPVPSQPPPSPRGAIVAQPAAPTLRGLPPIPPGAMAGRPTIAAGPGPSPVAVVDQLFNGDPSAPAWARSTMVAGGPAPMAYQPQRIGADDPTRQPMPIDPKIAAFANEQSGGSAVAVDPNSSSKPLRTGMRKGRSRLQIALWVLVGGVMIGGGVVAGFQIRAMRLGRQIAAAREQAVELAKNDTWTGWVGARERLARIADASNTPDNRAALARARALVAFEFGDGLAEAAATVDGLEGGGLDAELARAYLALAHSDGKTAKAAADRASELSQNDAAALYVTGQAAILLGDMKAAVTNTKAAHDKEPRALYAVGLARAHAAASQWDDALAAAATALKTTPDHPGALIQKAVVLVDSGRIAPGAGAGNDVRMQLDRIVAERAKPAAEQPRGVSRGQAGFAGLALARVDFMRGDAAAAKADALGALRLELSEQRFGEEVSETLYAINLLGLARKAVAETLQSWPTSRRARVTLAAIALADNKPLEAVEIMEKLPELDKFPRGLAMRGQAKLAAGNVEGAKADFDAALKKAGKLEPAVIGRAWIELRANDLASARKRIEPRYGPAGASAELATVYAAILRATADPEDRKKAKAILERVVAGQRNVAVGHAWLELARLHRDLGDMRAARKAYEEAVLSEIWDARVETGLLQIEDRDPLGGRDTLDRLLNQAGANAPPLLLLEAARARMIAGDNPGAAQLLEAVDKLQNFERWRLERERGRLALRRADYAGAAQQLTRALDGCGDDAETFLLAAEVGGADLQQTKLVDKLRQLAPKRLQGRPEALIVTGKLALAEDKNDDAEKAYQAARTALDKESASPRRHAQADFGYAVVLYNKKEDALAKNPLQLVIELDPSLYSAWLYLADLVTTTDPRKAFDYAQKAVTFNPDFVGGWVIYGTLAARLRKRADLATAITRVGELAPNSDALRQLQNLR